MSCKVDSVWRYRPSIPLPRSSVTYSSYTQISTRSTHHSEHVTYHLFILVLVLVLYQVLKRIYLFPPRAEDSVMRLDVRRSLVRPELHPRLCTVHRIVQ